MRCSIVESDPAASVSSVCLGEQHRQVAARQHLKVNRKPSSASCDGFLSQRADQSSLFQRRSERRAVADLRRDLAAVACTTPESPNGDDSDVSLQGESVSLLGWSRTSGTDFFFFYRSRLLRSPVWATSLLRQQVGRQTVSSAVQSTPRLSARSPLLPTMPQSVQGDVPVAPHPPLWCTASW